MVSLYKIKAQIFELFENIFYNYFKIHNQNGYTRNEEHLLLRLLNIATTFNSHISECILIFYV